MLGKVLKAQAEVKESIAMGDLSINSKKDDESSGLHLEPQEKLILQKIATGEPPYNQRAQSLLEIDAGATHSTSATETGQTEGQVDYWLGKFRRDRMNIFPIELLQQTEPEQALSGQSTGAETPSESPDIVQQVEQDARKVNEISDSEETKLESEAKTKKKSKKAKKKKKKGKKKKAKKSKKKDKKKKKKGKKKK
jgi:hypothetical protein